MKTEYAYPTLQAYTDELVRSAVEAISDATPGMKAWEQTLARNTARTAAKIITPDHWAEHLEGDASAQEVIAVGFIEAAINEWTRSRK